MPVDPSFRRAILLFPDNRKARFQRSRNKDGISVVRHRRTVGVRPNTAHLRLAITNQPISKLVLNRLLCWQSADFDGYHRDIDPHDAVLRQWIDSRKRQGDEMGEWLEVQLDIFANRGSAIASDSNPGTDEESDLANEDHSNHNSSNE